MSKLPHLEKKEKKKQSYEKRDVRIKSNLMFPFLAKEEITTSKELGALEGVFARLLFV